MRKLHHKYKLNRCLADSDGSIDDYDSVGSDRVHLYGKKYKSMMRVDGKTRNKAILDVEKRDRLDRVLGKKT